MVEAFKVARTPEIYFGAGQLENLAELVLRFGRHVLLVTGGRSFINSIYFEQLLKQFKEADISHDLIRVSAEPSPLLIDGLSGEYRQKDISTVVSIGGGSVLDAGKALSAMIPMQFSVFEYLEGVGTGRVHDGSKIPFIAVPTTSGTGSEATKNAVLSNVSYDGFKRSLRHDNFVPDIALVDPLLTVSCPPEITAACGMDAFTQLLESYVSTSASSLTDVMALSGLRHIEKSLARSFENPKDLEARAGMSYASLISGITLANAGLGIVHGLASAIGGYFDIPHGVVCGTLMGVSTRMMINKLLVKESSSIAIKKYARAGQIFTTDTGRSDEYYCNVLSDVIDEWTEKFNIPSLDDYNITPGDVTEIIDNTVQKQDPVKLDKQEIKSILIDRM